MTPDKEIIIDNLKIAYSDVGSGDVLLFVHGFGSYSLTWEKVCKKLSNQYRCIALDLKGFGYSDKPHDECYTAYDQKDMLAAFIERLKLERLVIIGHSFGGIISILTVLDKRMKGRIKGLVLIDSVGYYHHTPAFIQGLRTPLVNVLALEALDSYLLARTVCEKVYFIKARIDNTIVQKYADILKLPGAHTSFVSSAKQFVTSGMRTLHKQFKDIAIPTHVIWGVDDLFVSHIDAYKFKHDLPNTQLSLIPECGHSPQEECPEETTAAIREFLVKVA